MSGSGSWRGLSARVRGARHRHNQDAVRLSRCAGGAALAAVMADGHGSPACFRSQRGARCAVAVGQMLCERLVQLGNPGQIKRWAEERLARELIQRWRERVARDLRRQPFTVAEWAMLEGTARQRVAQLPALAYGTTWLAVVVAADFMLCAQLGDGDLVVVSESGAVSRLLPKDGRLLGGTTTSLCSEQAENELRLCFQTLAGAPPALILAATDGYADSFRDEDGFRQAASDFWALLRAGGAETVRSHLRAWLTETSREGSGDDIALALLWRHADTEGTG